MYSLYSVHDQHNSYFITKPNRYINILVVMYAMIGCTYDVLD
jgi:hypothetical protein